MTTAMEIHDSIIRTATSSHSGYEVKQNGDGFMIAFPTAVSALHFCLAVQQRLISDDTHWPEELLELKPGQVREDDDGTVLFKGLRLRMSAHWGEPVCNWNEVIARMDYLGPMVNRAARFIQVTEGGQIVVSEEFLEELGKAKDSVDAAEEKGELGPIWRNVNAAVGTDPTSSASTPETSETTERNPLQPEGLMDDAVVADLEDLHDPSHASEASPTPQSSSVPSHSQQQPESAPQSSPPPEGDTKFEVRLLGAHQFKGIEEPQRLYFIIPRSLRGRIDHWPKQMHVAGSKGNILGE